MDVEAAQGESKRADETVDDRKGIRCESTIILLHRFYFFISEFEFLLLVTTISFIEHVFFISHNYGTSKQITVHQTAKGL